MVKVVLDTNIIISGIISSKSYLRKILNLWHNKKISLVLTKGIIKEILQVLKRPKIKGKYQLSDKKIYKIKKSLTKDSIIVSPKKQIRIVIEYPDDDKFISCAIASKAKYIISGDKHLLDLKKYKNIKIVNAKDFLTYYGKGR